LAGTVPNETLLWTTGVEYLTQARLRTPPINETLLKNIFGVRNGVRDRAIKRLMSGHLDVATTKYALAKLADGSKEHVFQVTVTPSMKSDVYLCYVVFSETGAYLPTPKSGCSCPAGNLFCSHMLAHFLLLLVYQIEPTWDMDIVAEAMPAPVKSIDVPISLEYALTQMTSQFATARRAKLAAKSAAEGEDGDKSAAEGEEKQEGQDDDNGAEGEEKQEGQDDDNGAEGEEKQEGQDDDNGENELALVEAEMRAGADVKGAKVVDICARVTSYLEKSKTRGRAHNAPARSSLHLADVVSTNNELLARGSLPETILRQAQRLQRLQLLTARGHIPGDLQITNYINFFKSSNESIIVGGGKTPYTEIPAEVLSAAKK